VLYSNRTGETFLGKRGEELLGSRFSYSLDDGDSEVDIVRSDGEEGVAEMQVTETDWKGESAHLVSLRDITESVELRERLFDLSITDELTGLSNRRGFMQLAQQQLNLAKRTGHGLVLIFVDMDGMKRINDTYGHNEGDQALIDLAHILKETFREADIIARIGGDEFTVLAAEIGKSDIDLPIVRLKEKIDAHNEHGGRRYNLSVSVGVASYDPESPCTIDELLARADASMYRQKWGNKKP
jgi:diguanylate cyclase (GGDEF)-like protein